jgi:predicted anti-sigma-YlaC factor YlaD
MKCSKVKRMLSAYLDGEVSEKEKELITEHTATCATCKTKLEELSATNRIIDTVEDVEATPYFFTRLMKTIKDREKTQTVTIPFFERIRNIVVPVGAIAILLVSLITGQQIGKLLYQIDTARSEAQNVEIEYLLGVNSLDDIPEGIFSQTYNELLTGGE